MHLPHLAHIHFTALQLAENQPYTEKQLKVDTKRKEKDSSVDFLASEYASTPRVTEPQDDKDPFEGRVDGLYLVLISLHGLVRGDRMELGKDPDTGGQVLPRCGCSPPARALMSGTA